MLVLTQLFTNYIKSSVRTIPHNLAETALPPSSVIVAPFTNAPARLLKNKQDPATSCGVPMRPRGTPALIVSPNDSKVAAIILLSKGPQAKVLELQTESVLYTQTQREAKQSRCTYVTFRLPRWLASTRLKWCRPALLELYANVSSEGTRSPSMLPILIMREGSSGVAAFSRSGVTSWVRSKTRWRLRVRTRVKASEGYSS